jgi:hypothetical protein
MESLKKDEDETNRAFFQLFSIFFPASQSRRPERVVRFTVNFPANGTGT